METVAILILLFIFIFLFFKFEHFSQGPSFNSVSSGEPVTYRGARPSRNGAFYIRRWRDPVPFGSNPAIVSRQVPDDEWDRSYGNNQGFQLG